MIIKVSHVLFLLGLFVCASSLADAKTYLGVLTTPPNTGPGGSCCSNVKNLDADNADIPTDDSCIGCSIITPEQYQAYLTAAATPAKTNNAAVSAAGAGITLTCSATPTLSGTYRIDNTIMTELLVLASHSLLGNPNIITTITVKDTAGNLHTFPSVAVFNNFYGIVAWYWVQILDAQQRIIAGQAVSFPASTSTAC